MVKLGNTYKVAQYSQWDGYPSGQGWNAVKFLTYNTFNLDLFKKQISKIQKWCDFEIKKIYDECSYQILKKKYPELCGDTGSEILNLIYEGKLKKIKNDLSFTKNSLFCEWGWSINLDTHELDCFKGFQKNPLKDDQPFYDLQFSMMENDRYYPIKLICSIPFNKLTEFTDCNDFENYINETINMGDRDTMDNGIPKDWGLLI